MTPLRTSATLFALIFALAFAGCGSDEGQSAAEKSGNFDCLSSAEVESEVNEIAEGFEASSAEVHAKQEEIAAIRAEEC
jgi:hypothetical protein